MAQQPLVAPSTNDAYSKFTSAGPPVTAPALSSSPALVGAPGSEGGPLAILNHDVEFIISFKHNGESNAYNESGNVVTAETQFQNLLRALNKAGLRVEARDGGDGTILVFVRIRSEKKLLGEVYRSRVRDWLHGIRPAAPEKETQKSLTKEPLTDGERLRLVYSLITLPESEGGAGITPKQGDWDLVESIFALHDHEFNKQWIKDWSTKWTIGPADLKVIRDRFGEKIAFYFAFLQAYFIALLFPSIVGLVAHLFLPAYSSFFAIMNCLWSVVFVEYWQRKQKDLAVKWGVNGCSQVQRKRAEFLAEKETIDPATGEQLFTFPAWKRIARQSLQVPFALAAATMLGTIIACTFSIEIFITEVYGGPLKNILKFLPTVILSTMIPTVSGVLTGFATKLTSYENYENQDSYEHAMTQKIFVLNFITGYLPLFLTAFVYVPFGSIIVPYLDVLNVTVASFGHDEKYTTSDTGFHINPSRLKSQMIYFVVTAQIVNFALETIVPFIKRKATKKVTDFQASRNGIDVSAHDAPEEKVFLNRVREEKMLGTYDVTDDLREMCMQFGYLALFSPIWPVTAISFLINNLVELRADAAKICIDMQRPIPNRADSIGPWLDNLGFLTWLGSITSASLVYLFSASDLEGAPPRDLTLYGLLFAILLSEHIYFGARTIVHIAFSKFTSEGVQKERNERFLVRKRYLEESLGLENELIRKEEEATGGEYSGVGVVEEGDEGRDLDDGSASEGFWRKQKIWQDAAAAGVEVMRYSKEKKVQ